MFRLLEAFIKTINTAVIQHTINAKRYKIIIKFRYPASHKQTIVEVQDCIDIELGLARWSESIWLQIYSPGPQNAHGPDPSAFSVPSWNHIFRPQSIYCTNRQVRLEVTSSSKVGGHRWLLNPAMGDVRSMAVHSLVEWLSRFTHILETHLSHFIKWTILLVLHDTGILMVNRSPVTLLTNTLVVFNIR